jgi:diguanylate cyclase (GGDEF)-like protein/PAS domain S-box-containing protein
MQNEEVRRIQAELDIQRSRYFDIYDNAPVGYCLVNEQELLVEANLTLANMLGVARSELINRPVFLCFRNEDRLASHQMRQQLLVIGETHTCELQLARSDGSSLFVQLTATSAQDDHFGRVNRFVLTDVTKLKEVAIEVQTAKEYAENIVETIREPLLVLDSELKILSVNRCFYSTFEVTPINTIGQFIYDLGNRQWDIPKLRVLFEEILPSESAFDGYEVEHDFSSVGRKTIILNARKITQQSGTKELILLAMEDATERKRISEESKASEARFRQIFSEAPMGIALINSHSGKIISANSMFAKIVDRSPQEVLDSDWMSLTHPDDVQEDLDNMVLLNAGSIKGFQMEKRYLLPDGSPIWISMTISPIQVEDKRKAHHLCMIEDINQRKKVEKDLKSSEERFRLMFDRATEGIVILSDDGKLLAANAAFSQMHGYTPGEMAGMQLRDLDTPEAAQGLSNRLARIVSGEAMTFEVTHFHKDGSELLLEVSSSLIASDGQRLIQAFHRDITERRRTEELVRELAYYDPLTGLANRMLLKDRLTQSMLAGERNGNYGALMFLDLDNFKPLNDQHGHDVGDLLLAEVAKRLKSCVRQIDTVARFGGDEFVVLLDDLTSDKEQAHGQAELVAGKIRSMLANPYVFKTTSGGFDVPQSIEHKCTASIGVALFLGQNNMGEEVLKWADLAMYNAKDAGRNAVCFCDSQMWLENTARLILEEDLREAVLKKQFCVYFQAHFDKNSHVIGADALVRWQHPSRGWVSPREFIPKAERTGLILPMGLWVLETACVQLALWSKRVETADLMVTVNVSGRQLAQRNFVNQVVETLVRTSANPKRLRLEMKESVLLADVEGIIGKMNALKDIGVGFSLDDFGTGFSSLAGLNRLPLDQIKIDQDFVRDILIDPDDAAVAKMVVALAGSMEVAVIAEGVETQEQRDFLAALGCLKYQGYLLSPALPANEFEALVARARA